jgi:hypothetical protein
MNWMSILDLIRGILPLALSAAGVPAAFIGPVVSLSADAETLLGPGTGLQKKASVIGTAVDVISAYNAAKPGAIADPEALKTAIGNGIDAGFNAIKALSTSPAITVAAAPTA